MLQFDAQLIQALDAVHGANGGALVVLGTPAYDIAVLFKRLIRRKLPVVPQRDDVQMAPETNALFHGPSAFLPPHAAAVVVIVFRLKTVFPADFHHFLQNLPAGLPKGLYLRMGV